MLERFRNKSRIGFFRNSRAPGEDVLGQKQVLPFRNFQGGNHPLEIPEVEVFGNLDVLKQIWR